MKTWEIYLVYFIDVGAIRHRSCTGYQNLKLKQFRWVSVFKRIFYQEYVSTILVEKNQS